MPAAISGVSKRIRQIADRKRTAKTKTPKARVVHKHTGTLRVSGIGGTAIAGSVHVAGDLKASM